MTNVPATTPFGTIPQSSALAEASVDSLSELTSKDPEHYTRQDRDKIVKTLREQRVKLAEIEANGGKRKAQVKAPIKALSASVNTAEDMGF